MSKATDIARLRTAIKHVQDEAQGAVGRRGAPSGWLGPLIAACEAHQRILTLAEEYSPELEHGDNGEWAFGAVLEVLNGLYPDEHHREPCGNHCACGAVVKTDEQMTAHLADLSNPPV